jgi:hypothetical protein
MSFDFQQYLRSKVSSLSDSDVTFTIDVLAGGFTNHTVRISFETPISFQSTHNLRSAILKHAPPYIASSPEQALSVHRQTVEAKALQLLAGSDPSFPAFAQLSSSFPDLRFPELIYHDKASNVLWISDLGNCRTLEEYLKSDKDGKEEHVKHLARELAGYISQMYRLTTDPPQAVVDSLKDNTEVEKNVEGSSMGFLADMVQSTLNNSGIEDHQELSQLVREGLQEKIEHSCLGMGDFWPASLLIDAQGKCGLMDWEYFGLTDPGSELGMFCEFLAYNRKCAMM